MILPKTYSSETNYQEHNGKPKLSYSQYTSWNDPKYKLDYIKQYMMGIVIPSGIFAEYGSNVGEYLEWKGNGKVDNKPSTPLLSDSDIEILEKSHLSANGKYEDEIVVDMGDFVIQGFIDDCDYHDDNSVTVVDTKTGSIAKKSGFYASEEYGQTTLYAYQKKKEGFDIRRSAVRLFDRKGNNMGGNNIRLSGEVVEIETPYSDSRAEVLLEDIRKTALEISEFSNS